MTNRQKVKQLEDIQNSFYALCEQLYYDFKLEGDTERALKQLKEDVDALIDKIKKRYQQDTVDTNYFICKLTPTHCDPYEQYRSVDSSSADQMMLEICEILSGRLGFFAEMTTIVYHGQELKYVGPQPHQVYEFRNKETGEMAWWGKFPGWGLEK